MKEIARLGKQYGFDSFVSLEEHMACGIGACKGCARMMFDEDGKQKYMNICQCGPVFRIERIINDV